MLLKRPGYAVGGCGRVVVGDLGPDDGGIVATDHQFVPILPLLLFLLSDFVL